MLIFEIFFAFFFTVAFPDTTYYKDFSRLLDMSAKVGGGERGGGKGGAWCCAKPRFRRGKSRP